MGFLLLGLGYGLNELAKKCYPTRGILEVSQEARIRTQNILDRRQYLRGYQDAMRELNPPSRRER